MGVGGGTICFHSRQKDMFTYICLTFFWLFQVKDVRLPIHLNPLSYKVQLVPFIIPDNYTIRGYTEIIMKCEQAGSNVTVHIAEMTIDEDSVVVEEEGGAKTLPISGHQYDKDREFYIVKLDEDLEQGKNYVIKIKFTAILRDGLKGFYRSSYKNDKGETVCVRMSKVSKDNFPIFLSYIFYSCCSTIATTQFQATDARRAFPCFDEPALKAKFEASLGRTRNMSSISNMPIKQGGQGVKM